MTEVVLVAAIAANGVIGRDGRIPWHLPEDIRHFRELTAGAAVVMGRRTWESLPDRFRPLPGRRNIVVTRDADWRAEGAERASSVGDAVSLAGDVSTVFVIGGAAAYAQALPFADALVLTELEDEVEGDTLFPAWNRLTFIETAREQRVSEDGTRFAFVTYRRR